MNIYDSIMDEPFKMTISIVRPSFSVTHISTLWHMFPYGILPLRNDQLEPCNDTDD